MSAAFDFAAERRMINTSDDPYEVLDWIADYRRHAVAAAADDDSELAQRFDELIEFATDRVVELKAARLRPLPTPRPSEGARAPTPAKTPPVPHVAVARPEPGEAQRREAARRRAEENAADRAAADQQARAYDEELRRLQERAAKAKARRDAALAETARIEADAKRVAAEAERAARDEAKRRAMKEAQDAERAAAAAEAATKAATTSKALARNSPAPTDARSERTAETPSSSTAPELTPLAALFQERLAEVMATPEVSPSRPGPRPAAPAPRKAAAPAPPVAPAAPADDLPPLTGVDLASFRTRLGVSQRALAAKLGVEQSSISKGEGKPATVLAPHLRKALHLAMQEPRDAARGAS